jgi:hypothetical protein
MDRNNRPSASTCSELAVLALLGALVVVGLAAQGLTLWQSLVSIGFGAGVLLLAWLWQLTLRRARTAPPPSRGQRVWNAVVFLAWLLALAAVAWWYAGRKT